MGERRMFAKTIVTSDAFLDMPMSARCLYFTLGMFADDDGFVNNPKSIMRQVGATLDDMNILIGKKFILVFDSGVIVIKHWRIHNYIRGDRKHDTKYHKELEELQIDESGAYTQKCLPPELPEGEDAKTKRQKAYAESELPYSFDYKIRQAFWNKKCPVCGKTMSSEYLCSPTIQHNIPISKGGKHELGNISVICQSCNASIRDKETEELNAKEVIDVWEDICQTSDRQVAGKCHTEVKLSKDKRSNKDIKGKYGVFGNVMLKAEEFEKLKDRFPKDYKDRIDSLSEYMRSKGKTYKDHYATILSWARKEEREKPKVIEPRKYKEFEKEDYEKEDFKAEQMPDDLRKKLGGMFNAS